MKKKTFTILLSMILSLFLVACGSSEESSGNSNEESKTIKIGFTPGPYSDQVKKGIEPILKEKGYSVELVEFNNGVQPNLSLAAGELDANIFQHTAYFENFKEEHKVDLTEVIKVPTAPMGLYSDKYDSTTDLADKEYTVAIPNDPPNIARALRILEEVGWLTLKEDYDPITVSKIDIVDQTVKIKFVEVEQAQLPRSIPDVDFALVNGNYILSSGRLLSSNLQLEKPPHEYQNLVAVRTEDKDKPFVKDLIEAYESPEFQKVIENDPSFEGFHRPAYFK